MIEASTDTDQSSRDDLPPLPASPPGPRGWPALGCLPSLARAPLKFLEDNFRTYGDAVFFRLGPTEVFQLNHPAHIQSVLVGRHRYFTKNSLGLSLVMGNGILTSEGELWRHQRRLLAPAFQPRHIVHYAERMVTLTLERLRSLSEKTSVDMYSEMMRLTLDIVLDTLFGTSSDRPEDIAFVGQACENIAKEFERMMFTAWAMVPPQVPLGPRPKVHKLRKELDEVLHRIISSRKQTDGDDLLSRMLAACEDTAADGGMTALQMRDEVVTIFLAGHETTADVLTCAFYLLGRYPAVLAKLREEVATVLGERHASMSDVQNLRYTDAVLRETMRLYPPVWATARQVAWPCEIAGMELRPGQQLMLPQWIAQRDERWYDQPEECIPERWLDGRTSNLPQFAYFPFGGGPRQCIGNHFAIIETTLVLATLLQHLEFELVSDAPMALLPLITLRPKEGLQTRIRMRREPSPYTASAA